MIPLGWQQVIPPTRYDAFLEFPTRDIVRCKENSLELSFNCNMCEKQIKTKRGFYTVYNDFGICTTFCSLPCYDMFCLRYTIKEDIEVDLLYSTVRGIYPTIKIGDQIVPFNLPYWMYTAVIGRTTRSKRKK